MARDYLSGKVMVAFKPEAEQEAIQRVLGHYKFEKVFNNDEFDNSAERADQVLARLYELSVPVGTEEVEVKKIKSRHGGLVEMVYRAATRQIRG